MPRTPTSTLFPYTTLFRSRSSSIGTPWPHCSHFLTVEAYSLRVPRRVRLDCEEVGARSEEHTSELQSQFHFVCRLLLEKIQTAVDAGYYKSRSALDAVHRP